MVGTSVVLKSRGQALLCITFLSVRHFLLLCHLYISPYCCYCQAYVLFFIRHSLVYGFNFSYQIPLQILIKEEKVTRFLYWVVYVTLSLDDLDTTRAIRHSVVHCWSQQRQTMADNLCGPSNALQTFQKHTSVDRTLQQDRILNRQAPVHVCALFPAHLTTSYHDFFPLM